MALGASVRGGGALAAAGVAALAAAVLAQRLDQRRLRLDLVEGVQCGDFLPLRLAGPAPGRPCLGEQGGGDDRAEPEDERGGHGPVTRAVDGASVGRLREELGLEE